MNNVILIGRLTKDPELKYIPNTQTAVASFTLAIDRPTKGEEKKADFPRIVVYGKQAENCDRYLNKGKKVAIQGSIQTGSYKNKDGQTVYTTDIVANRVEFIEWTDKAPSEPVQTSEPTQTAIPEGFRAVGEDDIPF